MNIKFAAALVLGLSLAGSAMASISVYSEDFNSTLLGSSVGANPASQRSGPAGGDYYFVLPGGLPSGWTSTGLILGYNTGSDISIYLHENPVGIISRTITGLTPGHLYNLTFDYWGDNEQGYLYGLDVTVNGALTQYLNQTIPAYDGTTHTGSIFFTATGPSTVLSFGETPADTLASPIIDNIDISDVSPTPEPAFYGLIGLGLSGLAVAGRRRKKS
jgi:hypothetical protein